MNLSLLTRTLTRSVTTLGAAGLLALAVPLLLAGTGRAEPIPSSASFGAPAGDDWLARMRQAGLHGDRSQIPYMVEAFQNPVSDDNDVSYHIRLSLLRPLAQLGATEALPALDDVIQSDPLRPLPGQTYADSWENGQIIALSKAVKARILAQSSAQGAADDKARASAEVKCFFQELGQTPESLNAAVAAYQLKNQQHYEAAGRNPDYRHDAVPVEVFAVRELADMAYRDRYRGFASLPDVARVDFRQDAGAALKARLAPLPREQRVTTLVDEISQEKVRDNLALRRAQLLADEGPSALPAITSRQQHIKAHRDLYPGNFRLPSGLSTLEDVQTRIVAADDTAVRSQMDSATSSANKVKSWHSQIVPGY